MEFSVHNMQKGKIGLHGLQAFLMVISWILDIVVFRKVSIDGRVAWHFALCFLTIIPLVYLTMTPRFPRTRKFANPYALAAVDVLFAILWLSAFASVTNWNVTNQCGDGCGVSKGVSGLAFFIWVFWCLTAAISLYGVVYFRREGYLPGASRAPNNASHIDPDKEAFSTAPHDDEYAPVHNTDDHEMDSRYGGAPSSFNLGQPSEVPSYHTGNYQHPQVHDEPTGYSGYGGAGSAHDGPAKFPSGRYDNV